MHFSIRDLLWLTVGGGGSAAGEYDGTYGGNFGFRGLICQSRS